MAKKEAGAQSKILVVDDDNYIRLFLQETLEGIGYSVVLAEDGEDALEKIKSSPPDLVLTDLKMPKKDGLELLTDVQKLNQPPGVIIITAYGTVETAVQAMKDGAFDYLTKPFSITEIESRLKRYFELNLLRVENRDLKKKLKAQDVKTEMIGQSRELLAVLELVKMVSRSDAPVFIQGESGTGKELVASAVHKTSDRADKPFLQLNCAAIPENLMESTLFGHVQGAFTGANKTTQGIFEETDGGTLLLDEVSEIPVGLQAKLLRVLQEQRFTKVGSHKPVDVDVRIIATTNHDIAEMIGNGTFREDLYYRLNVVPIRVPPLRERPSDIPLLLDHFIAYFCEKYRQEKKTIDSSTLRYLQAYDWRGNIRELKNHTERALLFSGSAPKLELEHFFPPEDNGHELGGLKLGGGSKLADVERQAILATLERTSQNRSHAARILAISVKTLRNKLKQYGLDSATAS
ncbi:MAG: sigma-54-dependent Fis family transcriptional regulator [Candidatus Marinimicrobia bacterium]|nr:sigma-54-dependent Fis family transcriptional regulator [Candidatus Neomarinimicrobiota bacterium]